MLFQTVPRMPDRKASRRAAKARKTEEENTTNSDRLRQQKPGGMDAGRKPEQRRSLSSSPDILALTPSKCVNRKTGRRQAGTTELDSGRDDDKPLNTAVSAPTANLPCYLQSARHMWIKMGRLEL